MASRPSKQIAATGAKLLPFQPRAEYHAAPVRRIDRRLRNIIIVANALAWVVIAYVLHAILS